MAGLIKWTTGTIPVNNPPAGSFYVGIDSSDGNLYLKNSSGVVTKPGAVASLPWGNLTGLLSNQADLKALFDATAYGAPAVDFVTTSLTLVGTTLLAPLKAGGKYSVTFKVFTFTTANPGIAFNLSAPAGSTWRANYEGTTTTTGSTRVNRTSGAPTDAGGFQTIGGLGFFEIRVGIETPIDGNLELQVLCAGVVTLTIFSVSTWEIRKLN